MPATECLTEVTAFDFSQPLPFCKCSRCVEARVEGLVEHYRMLRRVHGIAILAQPSEPGYAEHVEAWRRMHG